jgi:HAMP domain-containing protein
MQYLIVLLILAVVGFFIWRRSRSKSRSADALEKRDDYGTLSMPPSPEAQIILSSMTEEENLNFRGLLGCAQEWHESVLEQRPLLFHPEGRAALWGAALSKIADHYHEIGRNDKALFFTETAWNLSKYPVFAYNAAVLRRESGDLIQAAQLFHAYLETYPGLMKSYTLMLVNPEVTANELEEMARVARARLSAMKDG